MVGARGVGVALEGSHRCRARVVVAQEVGLWKSAAVVVVLDVVLDVVVAQVVVAEVVVAMAHRQQRFRLGAVVALLDRSRRSLGKDGSSVYSPWPYWYGTTDCSVSCVVCNNRISSTCTNVSGRRPS